MIHVGSQGRHYTLNGSVVRPEHFYGIGGFKFANHVWGWITAGKGTDIGGGVHLSNAKRYIEHEVVGNGCRRMRAPIELLLWTGPYFDANDPRLGDQRAPNIANTLELMNLRVGTGSGFSLTSGMKKLIRMYVVLAREFDIVIEIPVLWTIKSEARGEAATRLGFDAIPPDPRRRFDRTPQEAGEGSKNGVAIWNEHVLAAHGVGAYLRELEVGGGGQGTHRVDPGGLNLIVDGMNEYTAHVPEIWNFKVLKDVARRWNEREKPGVPILISQSGPADRYDPPLESSHGSAGFPGVCGHFPRSGEWAKTGNVSRGAFPGELIDSNESQMGWTEEEKAFWAPLIPKWLGLGTTDMATWRRMHENFIDNEIYTTFHTKRAMDGGWPNTPQTEVEETIRSITEAAIPAPPAPPPGPPPPPPPEPEEPEVKVTHGANFAGIKFGDFPLVVDVDERVAELGKVEGNKAWRKEYRVDLGRLMTIVGVRTFFGHDNGDSFEMACTIYGDPAVKKEHLRYLVDERIEEDVAPGGKASAMYVLPRTVKVRELKVIVVCRVTGKNKAVEKEHPSYDKWRGVFDLGITLIKEA